MPSTPTLAAMQRLLWRLITAPEGVAVCLAADVEAPTAAQLEAVVAGNQRLSAVERLEVYANMYFYRLRDSLEEDYPAVAGVVGDAEFHNLITDYLLTHPPSHPSLRYAGQHLPGFLATHRLVQRWPFVAELAQLEWAILDAFDAPDSAVLTATDLEGIPAEQWAAVRFVPSPALRVLELTWGVEEVWEHAPGGESIPEPRPAPTTVQVWRHNLKVFHRTVDQLERDCLQRLSAGAPFGEWCEHAADQVGDEQAPIAVGAILQRWLREGILASVG